MPEDQRLVRHRLDLGQVHPVAARAEVGAMGGAVLLEAARGRWATPCASPSAPTGAAAGSTGAVGGASPAPAESGSRRGTSPPGASRPRSRPARTRRSCSGRSGGKVVRLAVRESERGGQVAERLPAPVGDVGGLRYAGDLLEELDHRRVVELLAGDVAAHRPRRNDERRGPGRLRRSASWWTPAWCSSPR